jgi:DNA-binding MarR family transcriptional regulator
MSNFALAKALLLFSQFNTQHPERSVTDLSRATGMSKSNVSKILREFRAQGFLVQDQASRATASARKRSPSGPDTSPAPSWCDAPTE